jgi:hypothetical protein
MNNRRLARRLASQRRQAGQAYVEYVVVVLLVVLVLTVGGKDSPIAQLLAAFQSFYSAYSYTLSMP